MKGIIYSRNSFTKKLIIDRFEEFHHKVIFSSTFVLIQLDLQNFNPDFLMLHCHTIDELESFDMIRSFTAEVKKWKPSCYIIIMHHPIVKQKYKKNYLVGYECDEIIKEDINTLYSYASKIETLIGGKMLLPTK